VKKSKSIYNPDYEYIITKLKEARIESGLKQEAVAEKIGKYQSYLSKIENGDRRIDVLELSELADIYNKELDYFVKRKKKI
jgi:transcriptional regulator with XRE-family HTH domain